MSISCPSTRLRYIIKYRSYLRIAGKYVMKSVKKFDWSNFKSKLLPFAHKLSGYICHSNKIKSFSSSLEVNVEKSYISCLKLYVLQ